MIPAQVVHLDTLPLSVNGKLDRKALPAPNLDTATAEYVAPRTPAEVVVSDVFAEILGVERVGIHDHFFDLGGNSLVATRLVSRLRNALGVPVSLRDVFDAPTVGGLAQRLDGADPAAHLAPPALTPRKRPEQVPLSPAQQRVWFLNQFDTASPVYNLPLAVRFSGDLDITALSRALRDVLHRHESLRTVFPASDAGPWQRIRDVHDADLDLTVAEVTGGRPPRRDPGIRPRRLRCHHRDSGTRSTAARAERRTRARPDGAPHCRRRMVVRAAVPAT
nr:condensation domain-containing protein [Rhodococcus koreensis]